MSIANRISAAVVRSSLVWGTLATLGFYAGVHSLERAGGWQGEFAQRYFANHWVLYVETAMFFVGLAALVLKAFDVAAQSSRISEPLLGPRPLNPLPIADARAVRNSLDELPPARRQGYLPRRLCEALDAILRGGDAARIDDELWRLSELDAVRQNASFGLVRIVIWAIPILGFLGTVIGITMAIGSLSPQELEGSLPEVIGGLGVAFDTTALALSLSMVLMFGQFFVDRREGELLSKVDAAAADELVGRFDAENVNDPIAADVRRLTEPLLKSVEKLAMQQTEIWQSSIDAANSRWTQLAQSAAQQLEQSLGTALARNFTMLADRAGAATEEAVGKQLKRVGQFQQALAESTAAAKGQQAELSRSADVFMQVVQATGQLARLEEGLNQNLAAVAGAQQFQQTMQSLAAALNLLNARLAQSAALAPHVDIVAPHPLGKAA